MIIYVTDFLLCIDLRESTSLLKIIRYYVSACPEGRSWEIQSAAFKMAPLEFHNICLPSVFDTPFTQVNKRQTKVRTNSRIFRQHKI